VISAKMYIVVFKKSAQKELMAIPVRVQRKIIDAIQLLSLNPYTELLQIKKIKGSENVFRIRIQDFRVIYLIEKNVIKITIIKIGHRKDVYE
jgi:mRNA interferase RelE/StbE